MTARYLAIAPLVAALALAAAGSAKADDPPSPLKSDTADAPSKVSPLVISGGPAAKLIASYPKDGAKIAAGVMVVSLTFDQAMSKQDSRLAPVPPLTPGDMDSTPQCLDQPRLLADAKTYVVLCATTPGKAYELDVSARPGLLSAAGRTVAPAVLHFSTSDVIVDNIAEALEAAGLSGDDDPVMTWSEVAVPPAQHPATQPPGPSPTHP